MGQPHNPEWLKVFKEWFISTRPGRETNETDWIGAHNLGHGSFGVAGLWVKIDPTTQKVLERIVIKECILKGDKFFDPAQWHNNHGDVIPLEAWLVYRLTHDPSNIVEHLGHRIFEARETYRLYMEYCALGDLTSFAQPYAMGQFNFPEPFLWKVLGDLAKAAVTMDAPFQTNNEEDQCLVHT